MGPFPCCSLFFWGIFCYTTSSLIQTHLVQANKSNGHKPSSSSSLRLSSKDLPSSTSFARIQDSPQLLLIPVQQQQQKKKSKASSSMSGGAAAVTSRGGGGEGDGDTTTVSAVATSAATAVPPTTTTTTSPATTTAATKQDKLSWEKIKTTIFPIYGRHERTKFLLLGSIKFFIILALTLTRDAKDTLVVPQCGAEAIAFLKIYGVLPAATAYIALYSNLSNRLSKTTLFYVTCIPFFVFFALFDMFIFPNTKILHPSLESVQAILSSGYNKLLGVRQPAATEAAQATVALSGGLAVMATIFANWTSALFYVMAEIYSSVSVGLLFWQFANDVVSVDQAKRFYPLFAQMSGLAPVLAGQYVVRYVSLAPNFEASMHRLTAAVSFAGCMICLFYSLSTSYVERTESTKATTAAAGATDVVKPKKKDKPKMSMGESARFLAGSQYLRLIACLVLGYGLSISFTEIMWKSLVKKQYPNRMDYQRFMGNVSSIVGLSTCIVIFFSVHVIRILGWKVGAMATPATMALLAVPFFVCILAGIEDSPSRLRVAVFFGTLQSLLSKTSKYALFDPTTQMAYIPLDQESKVKGKAAIDVLGSRIGKSGGSFIQQGLVFQFGNMLNAAPVVGVIFYSVLFTWLAAANRLSGLFLAQTEMDKANKLDGSKNKKEKPHNN